MLSLIKHFGIELKDKRVAILGTGGTSQTALAVCQSLMAKEIYLVSRNKSDSAISYAELFEKQSHIEIIINTTPLGMYPDTESMPISPKDFENLSGIIDVVYNPINTALVTEAKDMGIKAVGGLYMLVAQAIHAYGRFTETDIDENLCEKIYNKILKEKQNIVLIGMPSSGKSTIARMSSAQLNKDLIDIDAQIEMRAGVKISEIFKDKGEDFFRTLEEEVIEDMARLSGKIIATGGGAILRENNIKRLKRNGVIVFVDRPLENLRPTSDRPLASDFELMKKRYDERYPMYLKHADIHLKTTQVKEENRDNLIKLFNEYPTAT
jgi:shikimate dehydrogenase